MAMATRFYTKSLQTTITVLPERQLDSGWNGKKNYDNWRKSRLAKSKTVTKIVDLLKTKLSLLVILELPLLSTSIARFGYQVAGKLLNRRYKSTLETHLLAREEKRFNRYPIIYCFFSFRLYVLVKRFNGSWVCGVFTFCGMKLL